jgi:GrpB-like predicted nucleotidyltransferase (UPF0157 family)
MTSDAADGHAHEDAGSNASSDEASLAAAIVEEVSLRSHQASWAPAFELERARLEALVPGSFVAIEHIGSTAVPGLVAKPIVDILAGVASLDGVGSLIDRLCENGYTTSAEFNASLHDRKWLMRWRDGRRTHHLHIVAHAGAPWIDRLVFRDALRGDAELARRYAELKIALAARHQADREACTDAKVAFVLAVTQAARSVQARVL